MDALQHLAEEFDLVIIEDAAQAIGAKWRGHQAGSPGIAAAFSFYPTKNLSAFGDAGLATTVDAGLSEHMRHLRNHGSSQRYLNEEVGWNCRIDAIQAAVLRVKLKYIKAWNEQRRERAATYNRLFAEAGPSLAPHNVGGRSSVTLPTTSETAPPFFHTYVIHVPRPGGTPAL